ncbi:MAG TPA: RT0821/Lpp0805 family surface protein [Stellaceae bacterium]|nr:RT0821/Lpp0805 family surface protein [Stellaceae bacterium]
MFHACFPHRAAVALALVAGVALAGIGDTRAQSGTFGTDQRYCDNSALGKALSTSKGNLIGSAAGGAAGGLIGNQFGKSEGKGVMTVLGVIGGALAGGYVGRSMDPSDQGCVAQSLQNAPANQSVAWQNPGSGSSYWVTPRDDRDGPHGEKCRTFITDAVVNGRPTKTQSTACREPDGAWIPVSKTTLEPLKPRPLQSGGALSDDTVFKVQQRLHELGFYVRDNIDGQWGPSTASAVKNFQRSKGMNPTGQLDLSTLTALDLPSDEGRPPPR